MARKVDLPEPLCPTNATDWPGGMRSVSGWSATRSA
jgi:hypothetical protein